MRRYKWLLSDESLKRYVPETIRFSEENMFWLLNRYRKVIVKPIYGGGGVGIIKVSQMENGFYQIHHGRYTTTIRSWTMAFKKVKRLLKPRMYLVQHCIPLATIKRRPFDLRVMVQRRGYGEWKVTGILAKVAGPKYIITNVQRSKGYVLSIEEALRNSNINHMNAESIIGSIDDVSMRIVHKLTEMYPKFKVWGLDIGIDDKGGIWFFEANSKPSISMFKRLKSRDVYREIKSYPVRNRTR